jgi:hypothetical protein
MLTADDVVGGLQSRLQKMSVIDGDGNATDADCRRDMSLKRDERTFPWGIARESASIRRAETWKFVQAGFDDPEWMTKFPNRDLQR